MGIDAIALLRPRNPKKLWDHVEEQDAWLVHTLSDGAVLFRTEMSYGPIQRDASFGRSWLTGFGDDLAELHDDPRGVLFFPDGARRRAQSYEEVVSEVAGSSVWVPARVLSPTEQLAQQLALVKDIQRLSSLPPRRLTSLPPARMPSLPPRRGSA